MKWHQLMAVRGCKLMPTILCVCLLWTCIGLIVIAGGLCLSSYFFFSISFNWINTVAVAVAGNADRGLAYQHIIWFRISVWRVSYDVFYYYHFATQFQVPNKRHLLLLLLSLCKHCEIHFKRMPHCVCLRSPLNDCWGDAGGCGRSEP